MALLNACMALLLFDYLVRDSHGTPGSTYRAVIMQIDDKELRMLLKDYFVQMDDTLKKLSMKKEGKNQCQLAFTIKPQLNPPMAKLINTAPLIANTSPKSTFASCPTLIVKTFGTKVSMGSWEPI
ncbi:hypothetical protein PHAVU_008G034066 [Phaseolus vulgaris]|uniref:Uncharacterized protein n=1 Tax=Phaseolus vulgaris TaxID=3885 RepID=V7D0D7_PHAVU|nr:hypothetical protein PHAVU_L008500g [Phaseolus vulgaris]ESW35877.1 hypothetical protein PHAVU_L008500g [Phaseolus vulgaris]